MIGKVAGQKPNYLIPIGVDALPRTSRYKPGDKGRLPLLRTSVKGLFHEMGQSGHPGDMHFRKDCDLVMQDRPPELVTHALYSSTVSEVDC